MKKLFLVTFSCFLFSCSPKVATTSDVSTSAKTDATSPGVKYLYSSASTSLHSTPSQAGTYVANLSQNDRVQVLRPASSDWYLVSFNGQRGYVQKYWLNRKPVKIKSTSHTSSTKNYSSGSTSRTIHTGPRGGNYYINKNGNKTYVKRK